MSNNFRTLLLAFLFLSSAYGICQQYPTVESATNTSKTIQVGPNRDLKTPGAAKTIAEDGDIIEIDAGTYEGDYVTWTQNNLIFKGVGGKAHIKMGATAISNQKALWVIQGNNTTIENIEFSGATVPDKNGAGIRQEGKNLIVRHCYFHDNEDGILTSANSESEILIEYSEFANNGFGNGYTHNMYIGNVKKFTIQFSYTHHTIVGHNIKTRASENHILYNQIMDGPDGKASRSIDIPDGGLTYIIGNVIQQGPATQNSTMVGYASESKKNDIQEIYAVNNTLVSDRVTGYYFNISNSPVTAKLVNNLLVGENMSITGSTEEINNLELEGSVFKDRVNYDYHLIEGVDAIDAGIDPGMVHDFDLTPVYHYVHPCDKSMRPEKGNLDVGGFECLSVVAQNTIKQFHVSVIPNPATDYIYVNLENTPDVAKFHLYDIQGRSVFDQNLHHHSIYSVKHLNRGVYFWKITLERDILTGKIIIQ